MLSISAADNIGENLEEAGDIPTLCPSNYLIPVTSTDKNDNYDIYRGYSNISVDIAAPGEGIFTLSTDNTYNTDFSGNSAAAPIVAGAVALFHTVPCSGFIEKLKSQPEVMSLLIKNYMMEYSDKHDDLTLRTVSGGRLNIFNTYTNLRDFCDDNTTDKFDIISLSPNPAFDNIDIYYDFENFTKHNIKIYDDLGRLLFNKEFAPNIFGEKLINIDVSHFPTAVYYLTLSDGENIKSIPFVVGRL